MSTKDKSKNHHEIGLSEARSVAKSQLRNLVAEIDDDKVQSLATGITWDNLTAIDDALDLLLILTRDYDESFVLYGQSAEGSNKKATFIEPFPAEMPKNDYGQDMVIRIKIETEGDSGRDFIPPEQVANSQPDYRLHVLETETAFSLLAR